MNLQGLFSENNNLKRGCNKRIMNSENLDIRKRVIGRERINWFVGYTVLALLLVLNGLGNSVINTLTIFVYFFLILTAARNTEIYLIPLTSIFLGYTNLKFNLLLGVEFDVSTLANLIFFCILIKQILFYKCFSYKRNGFMIYLVLVAYCATNILITNKISQTIWFACKALIMYQAISVIDNGESEGAKEYTFSMFIAVVAEIFYGIFFPQITEEMGWRASQFGGVFDPNNFALDCLVLFCLTQMICKDSFPKWFRILTIVITICGVFASVSFTGLCGLIVLLIILMFKNIDGRKCIYIILGLIVFLFLINLVDLSTVFSWMRGSKITALKALEERLSIMLYEYNLGDFNGLTSGRANLWNIYFEHFNNSSTTLKIFGNQQSLSGLIKLFGKASHNFYLDFLIGYGVLGIILLAVYQIYESLIFLHDKRYARVVIKILFLGMLYSRTVGVANFLLMTSL